VRQKTVAGISSGAVESPTARMVIEADLGENRLEKPYGLAKPKGTL
jgi:hypothetical protein